MKIAPIAAPKILKKAALGSMLAMAAGTTLTSCGVPAGKQYLKLQGDSIQLSHNIEMMKSSLDKHTTADYEKYELDPSTPGLENVLRGFKEMDLKEQEEKMETLKKDIDATREVAAKDEDTLMYDNNQTLRAALLKHLGVTIGIPAFFGFLGWRIDRALGSKYI